MIKFANSGEQYLITNVTSQNEKIISCNINDQIIIIDISNNVTLTNNTIYNKMIYVFEIATVQTHIDINAVVYNHFNNALVNTT